MSIRSRLALVRQMPRVDLYGVSDYKYTRFDPHSERHWTKRKMFGGSKEWGERWGERQSYQPIGNHIRKLPFYLAVPSEPYNADWLQRREMVRVTLLDLQRMVDLGRIDPNRPVDLTDIANTKLIPLKERQYGYQLTDDGINNFAAKFARLEVQHASEAAIAAIESRGGRVICRFYDLTSVAAKANARAFFASGQPIPACKLPPACALDYYASAENRGYLADAAQTARCRYELAQKYGYSSTQDAASGDEAAGCAGDKSPRQIFSGLEPGWVVSLTERLVYKPRSPDVLAYYRRSV